MFREPKKAQGTPDPAKYQHIDKFDPGYAASFHIRPEDHAEKRLPKTEPAKYKVEDVDVIGKPRHQSKNPNAPSFTMGKKSEFDPLKKATAISPNKYMPSHS